jgi:hypothetical protein
VCWLNKSIYGLKQSPQVWYHCFASYVVSPSFVEAKSDTAYLLLYINDIVLTASSPELLQRTTTILQQ